MLMNLDYWNKTYMYFKISVRNLWAYYIPNILIPWYTIPQVAWILPLLSLILDIGAFLLLSPHFIQFLRQQVSNITRVTTNHVLVQNKTFPNLEADD